MRHQGSVIRALVAVIVSSMAVRLVLAIGSDELIAGLGFFAAATAMLATIMVAGSWVIHRNSPIARPLDALEAEPCKESTFEQPQQRAA